MNVIGIIPEETRIGSTDSDAARLSEPRTRSGQTSDSADARRIAHEIEF